MKPLIRTAPEKIYLCISDDRDSLYKNFPENIEDISWSDEACTNVVVKYIRSDLVKDSENFKNV